MVQLINYGNSTGKNSSIEYQKKLSYTLSQSVEVEA